MTPLPPIHRTVVVSWDQTTAFRRFTEGFADWWPWRTHSIGGTCIERLVFECRPGGLIFEQHTGGRRFQWGRVLEVDAPHRVKFTWHPARDPATAQDVDVRFVPDGAGTRVDLISDNWDKWGKNAHRARKGYDVGWGYVLNVWAGRRTTGMAVMDGLMLVARGVEVLRGGTKGSIARAGGEIPLARPDLPPR